VNDNDMQTSALALHVAASILQVSGPGSPEVQAFIGKAADLSKSHLI
jgi:hypothetical protein